MIEFAEKSLKKNEAARFFTHRLLCTEIFLSMIEQLEQLSEDGTDTYSGLGGFSVNATKCCIRVKRKLAELQADAPNTMRICHTIVGYNAVAANFTHRVGAYLEQGFFPEDLADTVIHAVLDRQRELERFFAFNPVIQIACSSCPRSHIVFQAYEADRSAPPRPAQVAGGGDQALSGSHSNGQSIADEATEAAVANPLAVDGLRKRQGVPADTSDVPADLNQQPAPTSPGAAVQMLRERQRQSQPRPQPELELMQQEQQMQPQQPSSSNAVEMLRERQRQSQPRPQPELELTQQEQQMQPQQPSSSNAVEMLRARRQPPRQQAQQEAQHQNPGQGQDTYDL